MMVVLVVVEVVMEWWKGVALRFVDKRGGGFFLFEMLVLALVCCFR